MIPSDILTQAWYEVYGLSWKGNITKRDGKSVRCGHKHTTWEEAVPCRQQMEKEKPGKCQQYRIEWICIYLTPGKLVKS